MLERSLLLALALTGPGARPGWLLPELGPPHPDASVLHVASPGDTLFLEVATVPDSLRTGDAFLLRIRMRPPHDAAPEWIPEVPDSLPVMGGLEPRGRVALGRPIDGESARGDWILEYPLHALRPGILPLPPLMLRAGGASGSEPAWRSLPLGSVRVHPHLPGGSGTVETRPPLPPPLPRWPGVGLLLSVLLVGAGLSGTGWLALGGGAPQPSPGGARPTPPLATRARAEQAREVLRMLVETLGGRVLEAKEAREVAGAVASAVRTILEHEAGAGLHGLTTSEILERLDGREAGGGDLTAILHAADRLRFGVPGKPESESTPMIHAVGEWLEARRA